MPHARPAIALLTALLALSLIAWEIPSQTDEGVATAEACWLAEGADTTDDETDDREVCRLETWFHRAQTPFGNVESVVLESFPSWDTSPPEQSVAEGAGGGYLGNSVLDLAMPGDPNNAATFEGTFTGSLENMAVTLYAFVPGRNVDGADHEMHIILYVDDMQLPFADLGDQPVHTTSGGNAVLKLDFAFTGIHGLLEDFGMDPGDADTEHQIRLQVASWHHAWDEAIYVYDTTEVPSGIVFNERPSELGDHTVIPLS